MSTRDRMPLGAPGRVPLGFQVVLAVGALLALLAAAVLIAVLLMRGIQHDQAQLDDRDVPYATAVANAALGAKAVANDERGFLISGDSRFVDEFNQRLANVRHDFSAAARAFAGSNQHIAIEEVRVGFERWVTTARGEFRRYHAGDRRGAIAASMGPNRALRKTYEASLARAQTLAASAINSGESSVKAASSRSMSILLALLFVGLVAGVAVAFWAVRTILTPVYAVLRLMSDPQDWRSPA